MAVHLLAAALLLTAEPPTPTATPPATPPAGTTTAADPMQEQVCRRTAETGSLVKARKTCHTRAQWRFIDDENQRFGRNLVDDTRSRPSGN